MKRRSLMHHFDLIVFGSPGGQRAATQAAKLGKRVAICGQRSEIGGVCIRVGSHERDLTKQAIPVYNGLPWRITNVRLRVDGVDTNGTVTASESGWVVGDVKAGDGGYFYVPVSVPAETYRATVQSFDKVMAATLRATSLRKRTVRAEPHTRAVRYRADRGLARADARQIAAVLTCAELLGFGAPLAI